MSEALMEYSSEKKCPVCGKKFDVLWPHQWAFKRRKPNSSNYYFYCSWKCIRELEKKGEDKHMGAKKILTEAQENTAIAMAIKGEDPRPYLEECGMKDGQHAWGNIRIRLRDNDPELFEKLPKVLGHKKRGPKKADGPKQEAPKAQAVEVHIPAPKITAPLVYDGMKVKAVSGEFGTYYLDDHGDEQYLDYSNKAGDELNMTVSQWRMFWNEFRRAAQILGVNL